MSAPTLIEPGRAWRILARSEQWLAEHQDSAEQRQVREYCAWLSEALETRDGLLDGTRHPALEFPELARSRPEDAGDALEQALEKAAEDIEANITDLVLVVREQCGQEAADFVAE